MNTSHRLPPAFDGRYEEITKFPIEIESGFCRDGGIANLTPARQVNYVNLILGGILKQEWKATVISVTLATCSTPRCSSRSVQSTVVYGV